MKCKKHPKYQAIRKPTADCQPCRDMWAVAVVAYGPVSRGAADKGNRSRAEASLIRRVR